MSTTQIMETIRQLPIDKQEFIAQTILQDVKTNKPDKEEKNYFHSFATDEEGYAAMAADEENEREALEWIEGTLNHEEL